MTSVMTDSVRRRARALVATLLLGVAVLGATASRAGDPPSSPPPSEPDRIAPLEAVAARITDIERRLAELERSLDRRAPEDSSADEPRSQPGPSGPDDPARPPSSPAETLTGWADPVGDAIDSETGYPKRIRRRRDDMEMVLVPRGTFWMGAVPGDVRATSRERPRRRVTLSRAYYLDEHEITWEMWARYERSKPNGKNKEGEVTIGLGGTEAQSPVDLVSWEDARQYARWAKVSLPTEAQWERAARGGIDGLVFPWGTDDDMPQRIGLLDLDRRRTSENPRWPGVKSTPPQGYEIYDLCGSVGEWCADRWDEDSLGTDRSEDPIGPARGELRVIRGAGNHSDEARISRRSGERPDAVRVDVGFRCAWTIQFVRSVDGAKEAPVAPR